MYYVKNRSWRSLSTVIHVGIYFFYQVIMVLQWKEISVSVTQGEQVLILIHV